MEITVELLKRVFEAEFRGKGHTRFLLDGRPDQEDQELKAHPGCFVSRANRLLQDSPARWANHSLPRLKSVLRSTFSISNVLKMS